MELKLRERERERTHKGVDPALAVTQCLELQRKLQQRKGKMKGAGAEGCWKTVKNFFLSKGPKPVI